MSPVPDDGQLAPPAGTHVQVTPETVAGNTFTRVAPFTIVPPTLVAVMVQVNGWPGCTTAPPSLMVTASSASSTVDTLVDQLSAGFASMYPGGTVMVAVF